MSHERQGSDEIAPDSIIQELEKTEAEYQILRRAVARILQISTLYHGPPSLTDSGIIQGLSDILDVPNPYVSTEEEFYEAQKKLKKEREWEKEREDEEK